MLIRVVNLLVALFISLGVLSTVVMRHQWRFESFAALALILVWIAGAIGLFYHKRNAWMCSLIAAGASLSVIVVSCLLVVLGISRDGRQLVGNTEHPVFWIVFVFAVLTLEFSVFAWLFVALLRLGKSDSWV